MTAERDPEAVFAAHKEKYMETLKPIFLPEDPASRDIIKYFAALLRVLGMEDRGWDPYAESRAILNDLNQLIRSPLNVEKLPDADATKWRLALLLYCHIVEMDAPYEVIANLIRFQLGRGYSPNPFFEFLSEKEKKGYAKRGIRTGRKIQIIKALGEEAGFDVGDLFDEFYDNRLRNAVQHSDFILAEDEFRCRGDISGLSAFKMSYEKLDDILTKAKAFIGAYFQIESIARQIWGLQAGKALPYDPHYKGLMEVLADNDGRLCGFSVHWPNNSQSMYKRTGDGVDMVNCTLDLKRATISLFVDIYAREPGDFSPLVEKGASPKYTPLATGACPTWPD